MRCAWPVARRCTWSRRASAASGPSAARSASPHRDEATALPHPLAAQRVDDRLGPGQHRAAHRLQPVTHTSSTDTASRQLPWRRGRGHRPCDVEAAQPARSPQSPRHSRRTPRRRLRRRACGTAGTAGRAGFVTLRPGGAGGFNAETTALPTAFAPVAKAFAPRTTALTAALPTATAALPMALPACKSRAAAAKMNA